MDPGWIRLHEGSSLLTHAPRELVQPALTGRKIVELHGTIGFKGGLNGMQM